MGRRCFIVLFLVFCTVILWGEGFYVLPEPRPVPVGGASDPMGLGVYVINLERSPKRLASLWPLTQTLGCPVQRIVGVDGQKLSSEACDFLVDHKKFRRLVGRDLLMGEIGCTLSHYRVWQAFLASPYAYALVLEDDVTFKPADLKAVLKNLLTRHRAWDICNLDIGRWVVMSRWLPKGALADTHMLCEDLRNTYQTSAYIINRKAGRALLSRKQPICMPIDWYYTRSWEFGLRYRTVRPLVVHQRGLGSLIQKPTHLSSSFGGRIMCKVTSSMYRFKTNIMRYLIGLWSSLFLSG